MSPVGRMSSYQGTRVPILPAGEVIEEPPVGGSEVPTLPADQIVGTAAWRSIGWGNTGNVYPPTTTFQTWRTQWGFGGLKGHTDGDPRPYGIGGTQDMMATSAESQTGSQFDWQRAYEGFPEQPNGFTFDKGMFEAKKAGVDLECYLGWYTRASQTAKPPMGDWWNDTLFGGTIVPFFARAALCVKNVLQGTGISFDIEPQENFAYVYGGHTLPEICVKIEQRSYEIGAAIFQNFPSCKALFYGWRPTGCWHNVLYFGNTTTVMNPPEASDWMARGMIRAMGDHGDANARCVQLDPTFYKYGAGGGGSSRDAKLKLNLERTLAYQSTQQTQATWNKICDRLDISPFSWPGTDGDTVNYPVTAPATYASQLAVDRLWGMGGRRGEYLYGGDGSPGNVASMAYSPSYLPGMVAAANPAPIASSLPTLTNLAWNGTTLTCRGAHPYGFRCARVYSGTGFNPANPEANYLGAMRMTWQANGGTTSTNFNNSYQDCTFTTSGPVGDWRVVKAISAKDDVRWARIQRTT